MNRSGVLALVYELGGKMTEAANEWAVLEEVVKVQGARCEVKKREALG
jgi:hypothetical protein